MQTNLGKTERRIELVPLPGYRDLGGTGFGGSDGSVGKIEGEVGPVSIAAGIERQQRIDFQHQWSRAGIEWWGKSGYVIWSRD